ncbi:MAG TPA: septation protein SepH [Nocardioidaceae bacterium]|nr:septation protein SepH [Nocardioidaceae bacterium]
MTKQDLTLVGLTEDKGHLILVSESGDEFRVAADAKLRAALRGETTRPGQLEIQMESALRPRDIQARIRAGESPEVVAAAAQTTVDKIMTFAMPVLAERAHVAERAQRASVRRRTGEGPGGLLGDAVAERLRSRNVDPESVEWDAWRREDGRWSLTASYSASGSAQHAAFVYDAAGRYVVAEDDESRWLVGERVATPPTSASEAAAEPSRRLMSVPGDEQLPLGEDAIELVSDPEPTPATPGGQETTADLTETARALRAVPAEELPISADHADADWMVTQASERPETRAAEAPSAEEPERPSKKAKRASVPSWDEIMFGSGRD